MSSTYHLDAEKLADAISILDGEIAELKPLVQRQNNSWPRNIIGSYIFAACLAAILILGIHEWISPEWMALCLGILIVGFVVGSLLLDYKQIRGLIQLRQTQRKLGMEPLKYIQVPDWKELKIRIPRTIPYFAGLLVLFLLGIFGQGNSWLIDLGILSFAVGLVITSHLIGLRNAQIIPERLRVAEQLRARLLAHQQSSALSIKEPTVFIPEVEYKEIARLEQALIDKERLRAVKQSSRQRETSVLMVKQSASVMQKKSALDSSDRLKIQTQIDQLSTAPLPPKAQKADGGLWRLAVPDTSWEIAYTLVEAERCIMINDLLPRAKPEQQNQGGASVA